jgi:hypothetical protein
MGLRAATVTASLLLSLLGSGRPAFAGAKAVQRYKATVEGQTFKVIRYDNGTVKIVDGGMFGPGYSINERDRMRRAAKQATGCEVADDFDQDGKLIGKLVCTAGPAL